MAIAWSGWPCSPAWLPPTSASNDLQTILRELALPLACVRRFDKRVEKGLIFPILLSNTAYLDRIQGEKK